MKKLKESGRIKAFNARVIRLLQRHGWKVEKQPNSSIVDLITTHSGGMRRAFITREQRL
jgi:hypothetical protein